MNDNTTPIREFVLRRVTEGLSLGGHEFSGNAWYLILGAVLAVGVVYVIWMYVRDGHSIGWFWGAFLALLRLTVYAILGFVFLLPAWQNWEETRQQSKVVVTFDISRSPNPHVGFGGTGAHYCIGANLARMTIDLMFNAIADHMPDLAPTGDPQRLRSPFINGIKHWPVDYK